MYCMLMEEILHQLIGHLSHYLLGFYMFYTSQVVSGISDQSTVWSNESAVFKSVYLEEAIQQSWKKKAPSKRANH